MPHTIAPYLSFPGTAREAMGFYQLVLGGELALTTFEQGGMPVPGEAAGWVMHGQLVTPGGLVLMGSDVPPSMQHVPAAGTSVALSGSGDDVDVVVGWYQRLAETGTEVVPLAVAPWGDWFGECRDRWGTPWLCDAGPVAPADPSPQL